MFFNNDIHSFEDARRLAKKRLPAMIFDYIDGAAGTGFGEQLNKQTIKALRLMPRVLNNVEHRDLTIEIFGRKTQLPFGISPMGMCNLAGPKADAAYAALASQFDIPIGVSTAASTSLEEMFELSKGNAWFQLYFSGNEEASNQLIERARNAGYTNLVLTVDVPEVGRRPRELRRGFKMPFKIGPQQILDFALHPYWSFSTLLAGKPQLANFGGEYGEFSRTSSRAGADWELLNKIRNNWQGKLTVKGVLNAEDALKIKSMGVDAIQISSHGGRQLDSAPPPILALKEIRHSVGKNYPLFYDSGVISGEDIVKAYAMGANFVFLGRPFAYGFAAKGRNGVKQITEVLTAEVSTTLAQLGLSKMSLLDQNVLWGAS